MHKEINRTEEDAIDALHQAGFRQIRYANPARRGSETAFTDSGMYEKGTRPDVVCARINFSEDHADPHIVCHKLGKATVQKFVLINRDWDLVGAILKLERELLS